jgi:hypothetical protein
MRINVYSQELLTDLDLKPDEIVQTFEKQSNTGLTYSAVAMFLHSSDRLHHPPADDDRSAIVFWLPRSIARRERLALIFERMAINIRNADTETGLD